MLATTSIDEFVRISRLLSGRTVSIPIVMDQINRISDDVAADTTLASLERELRAALKVVARPEDYDKMAQAYATYSEACLYLAMKERS